MSIQAQSQVCESYTSIYHNIIIDEQEYSGFAYLYDNITKINNNNIQLVPYNHNKGDSYTFDYVYNTTWYNLSFVSDSDASGLLKFIKQFDPCLAPCSTGVETYFCPREIHDDGVCNPECNITSCGFDGGDCDQLCNLYTSNSDHGSNTS